MPKKIQTRIQHKHDIEANWKLATGFVPLAGELIIYDQEIDPATGATLTLPPGRTEPFTYKRFKLGDGRTPVDELPFQIISAESVYFDDDITVTTPVGNIEITNGSGIIPAAGKNLKQVFEAIWTEELDPITTQPAVSIPVSVIYKEVGAKIIPTYEAALSAGSYSYGVIKADIDAGKTGGVIADTWSVTFDGQTRDTAAGTFNEMTVTEGNCCSITATATYADDDAIPATNLGNPCASKQIKAGTASLTKNIITGYRPNFYGFKTASIDLATIDSSAIRGLTTNQKQTTSPVSSAKCTTSWMQFFYAVPKGRRTSLSVKDSNNLPLTVNRKEVTVNHENGVTSTYTVFYINNDAAYGATTLALTWS